MRNTEFRDEERARRLRWIPQIQQQFQLRTGRAKHPDPGLQTSGRERTAPRSRERGFDRYENRWETASRPHEPEYVSGRRGTRRPANEKKQELKECAHTSLLIYL